MFSVIIKSFHNVHIYFLWAGLSEHTKVEIKILEFSVAFDGRLKQIFCNFFVGSFIKKIRKFKMNLQRIFPE